jgi:CBS domain containing-hemolysin-like protein
MIGLLVTFALLCGNAFFVAAEFSLIAARSTAIEPLAETSRRARATLRAMRSIPLMVAGSQLGITLCSLGLGAISEPAIASMFRGPFALAGIPEAALHPTSLVLALVLVVFAHTVIGEMVPKNLTLAGPEQAVLWLGPPILWFCMGTRPLLISMQWACRIILRLWSIDTRNTVKTVFTADELVGLAAQARTEGLLDREEEARIAGALTLSRQTARDVLQPWPKVTTVTQDISPASLELLATKARRSRFPVVELAGRRVLGFVHVKDILGITGSQRRTPISAELIRPLASVPPDRSLADVLLAMRRERRHIVLVSDGTSPLGVVTLDDVLTAVVGENAGTDSAQNSAI